jgi:TrkA domain protein
MAPPPHPPRLSRARLPAIGTRTELHTGDGTVVSVVELPGGATDLQIGTGPPARLSGADARALGAVLAGTFTVDPALLDDLGAALGGLQIDAFLVTRDGPLAGRSIGDLEIRRRHGVTVAAVLSGSLADVAPGPETVLRPGDRVVVLGRPDAVEQFRQEVGAGHGT